MTHGPTETAPAAGQRPAAELRAARWATAVVFAVHGAVMGSFAARLPWIAEHVDVSTGELGVALLMPGVGAMVAMPFAGRLTHRYPYRRLVPVTITLLCAFLVLPALPTSLPVLCLTLLAYGAAAGLADMAMNAQAALVEKRYGRSVMSSLHGFWSVGVLAGSAVAALAAHRDIGATAQFAVVGVALATAALLAARRLIEDHELADAEQPPAFALPSRPVLLIGLVGLCAVFGEQAGLDWSAVYIETTLGGSPGVAALAVTAFAATMALARLLGDRVIDRLGAVTTARASGACAVLGAALIVAAPAVPVAMAGFALLGAGVAVVVPLVFAAAGRIGPHPGRSIAGVAGVAYGSGLVTPGVIGGIASATSLSAAYVVVAVLAVAMALGAVLLRTTADR